MLIEVKVAPTDKRSTEQIVLDSMPPGHDFAGNVRVYPDRRPSSMDSYNPMYVYKTPAPWILMFEVKERSPR